MRVNCPGCGCGSRIVRRNPAGDEIEQGQQVIADPSSMFLSTGGSEFVVVQVLDGLGNQLPVNFEALNVGAGITVERDTTYLQTTIGTNLETAQRFIVTGTSPTATQFELASNGVSTTIPVKVTPASTSVTLSNPTPVANEALVVTLPSGYKFGAGAGVTVAATPGITTAIAADSTSVTVVLPPGTTGPITVDSVAVDFVPGVLFSLPTSDTVTVGAATALPGSASPSTAPALPIPAAGGTTATFDLAGFYSDHRPLLRAQCHGSGRLHCKRRLERGVRYRRSALLLCGLHHHLIIRCHREPARGGHVHAASRYFVPLGRGLWRRCRRSDYKYYH